MPMSSGNGGITASAAPLTGTAATPGGAPAPLPAAKPLTGLLHSAVAGRTDHLDVKVPAGSYVIPADVVSGTGEGNTLAGARILQSVIEGGPHGTGKQIAKAGGGEVGGEMVPILGAGGEMVVHPEHVKAWGGGNIKRGHALLDHWVVAQRKRIVKEMSKLPGPVKD